MAAQAGAPAIWRLPGRAPDPPGALPDPQLTNPFRRIAFYASLGLIFLRYSLLHESMANLIGTNGYILFVLATPALVGAVASGGLQRTFSAKPARFWAAFAVWFLVTVPFSFWKGDSVLYAWNYYRTNLPMLLVMAGLAVTWKECRTILVTIGLAGIFNIGAGLLFPGKFGGRDGLATGIVANPNDYAGHLLLLLPIVFYLVLFPPSRFGPLRFVVRVAACVATVLGMFVILRTASRGALIALGVGALFMLIKSKMSVRIAALASIPVVFVGLWAVVPHDVRNRLESIDFGTSDGNPHVDEAEESSRLRRHLLEESLVVTFHHPLFGVGPGQFGNYEGRNALWLSTHNSFTEISSECGIPGLVLFLGGVIGGFWMLLQTWRRTRGRPALKEIATVCYCLSLSFVMFCSAVFFLNFAYFFYFPAATGLFIVISRCAQQEFWRVEHDTNHPPASVTPPFAPPRIAPQPQVARQVAKVTAPAARKPVIRFNGYR